MAMTIKGSPIVSGESAEIFFELAEKNGSLPTPAIPSERKKFLDAFLEKSKNFNLPF